MSEEDAGSAEAGTAAEKPAAESTGDEPSPAATPEAVEEEVLERYTSYYITHIHDGVMAEHFSVGPAGRRRHRTGPIGRVELEEALRFFHAPPCFAAARAMIATDNLVVLCGPDGSGRRCAALAVLRDTGAEGRGPVEQVEPATTLESLLEHAFDPGGRYLLADFHPVRDEGQVQFQVRQLRRRVREAGAFLVVTTEGGTQMFAPHAVSWHPTTAAVAFAAHRGDLGSEWTDDQKALAQRVLSRMQLDRLARFIDDVRHDGIDTACAPFEDQARSDLAS